MAQITWRRNGREPLCRSGAAAGALLVGLVSSVVTGETLFMIVASGQWSVASQWQMADGRWQMADGRWQMADDANGSPAFVRHSSRYSLATGHYSEPLTQSHWLCRQGVEGLFQVAVHSRQVGWLAVKNDLPIMDEKDPVGHRLDLLENVGRNQNCLGLAQVPDQRPNPANLVRIEAAGGLVHDQDLGVMKQRLGHRDPLPIALRKFADRLVGHGIQCTLADDGIDTTVQLGPPEAAGFAEKLEQAQRRHVGVERAVLGQVAKVLCGADTVG